MEHPVSFDKLPAAVKKVCNPKAPPQLRAMAAGGLAPLKPGELVTALYVLSHDSDAEIAQKAQTSLQKMPPNILLGVIEKLGDPFVIDGIAHLIDSTPDNEQKILLNQNTAAETVIYLISIINDDKILELAATNEARLLGAPGIIEALFNNPNTRMSTVDRAVELAIRNGIELTGIPSFNELKAAITGELIPEPSNEPTPDDILFADNLNAEKWKALDEESVDAAYGDKKEASEETKEEVQSAVQSIAQLNTSAKIRIATLGNATQRSILVRDSNKLVVLAVLKSPLLNESEVRRFSRFKTLPEEAVRFIAGSRDWTKHYSVKLNLVQNPRCPIEYTLRFLPHIRVPELRGLSRDKNVPQAVARAAKQLLQKRMR